MLVDDEPNILIPLEFLVKQQGYTVEKADNGTAAMEKAAVFHPDIIILDVMMPGLDGFEVARRIRLNPDFEDTRIIFLTAKNSDADRLNGYKSGGEVYINKPFDNNSLISALKEMVEFG